MRGAIVSLSRYDFMAWRIVKYRVHLLYFADALYFLHICVQRYSWMYSVKRERERMCVCVCATVSVI